MEIIKPYEPAIREQTPQERFDSALRERRFEDAAALLRKSTRDLLAAGRQLRRGGSA